jgi:hypothetical protein
VRRSHGEVIEDLPNARFDWLDCGHNDCPFIDADYRVRVLRFLADAGVLGR